MMDGLFEKYTVTKNQGTPTFKGNHFVLFPKNDIHARRAVMAYAKSCEQHYPQLSMDLETWLDELHEEDMK